MIIGCGWCGRGRCAGSFTLHRPGRHGRKDDSTEDICENSYSDWRSGVPVVRNHSVIPRPKRRVTRNSISIFHQFLCINSLHHSEIFWYTLDSKLRTTQPSFNHNKALNPVTKPATHNPAATFSSNITDSIHTIKGNHIIQQPLFLATSPTPSIPSKAITSSSSHFL
uniref:Uncharacterized protein n=1 Tax=Timema poppense TaxID=170557 RepID=A0A7R9H7V0_TIMPO|nr:unnamed protein product [Timema poppensis]